MSRRDFSSLTAQELESFIAQHSQTQALLDHLERKNRIPRVGRYFIPTRAPWWIRWLRNLNAALRRKP